MTAPPTHSRRPNDSPASNQDDKAAADLREHDHDGPIRRHTRQPVLNDELATTSNPPISSSKEMTVTLAGIRACP